MVIAELNAFIKLHEEVLSYFCMPYNIMVVIDCCRLCNLTLLYAIHHLYMLYRALSSLLYNMYSLKDRIDNKFLNLSMEISLPVYGILKSKFLLPNSYFQAQESAMYVQFMRRVASACLILQTRQEIEEKEEEEAHQQLNHQHQH
jgi:hypothetical protein